MQPTALIAVPQQSSVWRAHDMADNHAHSMSGHSIGCAVLIRFFSARSRLTSFWSWIRAFTFLVHAAPICTMPSTVAHTAAMLQQLQDSAHETSSMQVIVLALGQGSSQLDVPPFLSAISQLTKESSPQRPASGRGALEAMPRETVVSPSSFAEGAYHPRDALFAETER